MAKDQKLSVDQQFGQWVLEGAEPLGKGGNGAVWQAKNAQGVRAAIKFLHKNHFEQPGQRLARFRDEVTFLKAERSRAGILPH